MPRLPSLTPRRVIAILEAYGFALDHTTGSHYIFYNPVTRRRVTVPYHQRDLPKGTLLAILRQAGLSRNDLL